MCVFVRIFAEGWCVVVACVMCVCCVFVVCYFVFVSCVCGVNLCVCFPVSVCGVLVYVFGCACDAFSFSVFVSSWVSCVYGVCMWFFGLYIVCRCMCGLCECTCV